VSEFVARIGTPEGAVLEQRHRSTSAEMLRRELEGRGLHVFAVREQRRSWQIPIVRRREKLNSLDFLIFNQQLATLLRAGIPVLQSLELLQRSQASPFFRLVLHRVFEDVKSGVALSEAFAAQGELFPRLYSATLMAGERSGELVSVLERFIQHQQLMEGVRRKVTSALTYPAVLVTLASGLIVLLVTYVIPRFAGFYADFGTDLPMITKIVVSTSKWLQGHVTMLGVGLVAAVLLGRQWAASPRGRVALDRFRLKTPFVGAVFHLLGLSQFTRSLATLLAGGTPLVSALEVATSTVTSPAISAPLAAVAPKVREGQALWSSLDATKLFPELSIAMVQVGEATGALEDMLFNSSRFYDESIEVKLARIVTLIEPAILVVMGGVVAFLLLSIYFPMFSLLGKMQ
jgi:type IV pilus assembly protein PilC